MTGPAPEDAFLASFAGASALSFALKSGLVDKLAAGPASIASLAAAARRDRAGVATLCGLLESTGVLHRAGEMVGLAPAFSAVMSRRRAIESKLTFLDLAARDVLDQLPAMLFDTPAYVAEGKAFELFRYDRALEVSEANIAFTRRWVDYTTALTEHEAPVLAPLLQLSGVRRLLDVGGNSGAFARALCASHPELEVFVLDLPVVAELGRRYLVGATEAARVHFLVADMRHDPWPAELDALCFKSVLHDWPEPDMRRLVAKALEALRPGGRLFIIERGRFEPGAAPLPFSAIANLVFSRFYRAPSAYAELLAELGFADIGIETVEIDMPFHVVSGMRGIG